MLTNVLTILEAIGGNATVQKYSQYIAAGLLAILTGSASFRCGSVEVTVSDNGAPARLTLGLLAVAIENVALGKTATVQIGSVSISFSPVVA